MDASKYLENLLNAFFKRQNDYALQILSGAKNIEEYKTCSGKYNALREAEDIAKRVFKEMYEGKIKGEVGNHYEEG